MIERPNTVLIASESPQFASLLSRRLGIEQDVEIVGQASDAKELMAVSQDTQPDVILLNFGLEDPDLIKNIKAESPTSQVVLIVQDRTAESARMAMRAGAQDILCAGSLF